MPQDVIIGLLGPSLDRGTKADRWSHWRPTVSLCQHEDRVVDRLELLFEPQFKKLAEQVVADIGTVSPETTVRLHEVNFGDPWDFEAVFGALYDFASAYDFDPDTEDYLVHITTGTHVAQICLFLLTESRHFPATLIQTAPPKRPSGRGRSASSSPGEIQEIDLDLSRYDRIAARFATEQREGLDFLKSGIETRNDAFNRTIAEIEHVAIHARDPILLTGPTGAGKSQLARRIYQLKQQRRQVAGPLVEVNCATIRGDTAMSTLFGHTKGAFTGAVAARRGLLAEADGGLLFLDEVGELGPDEQTMLLRAVEEKRFLPVGSDQEASSDFQLICGTHRNLRADARSGRFREDLLARINLWAFRMPALAERRDDIPPNIAYELQQLAQRTGRRVRFNKEAEERFLRFAQRADTPWSGNFRDLAAAISRMATMAPTDRITTEVVDGEIERLKLNWRGHGGSQSLDAGGTDDFGNAPNVLEAVMTADQIAELDLFDRAQLNIVVGICRTSTSLSDAGRKLFAVSREQRKAVNDADRLRKYLVRFGLRWDQFRSS